MMRSGRLCSGTLLLSERKRKGPVKGRDLGWSGAAVLEQYLNALQRGVLLLSRDGKVQFANAAAQAQVALGDPVALVRGRLRLLPPPEHARLEGVLEAHDVASEGAVLFLKSSEGREFTLMLQYLGGGFERDSGFIAFLFAPDAVMSTNLGLLQKCYGLTPSEAAVADSFYHCCTVRGVAEELECSINTIRVHLKRIFKKCGVHSQAELVRRLALEPYWG